MIPFYPLDRRLNEFGTLLEGVTSKIIKENHYILGEDVQRFEQLWARQCQVPYAVGVADGTDALEIALRAVGVKAGDEVIVPAFTFAATLMAVANIGAVPVAVDVSLTTATIAPDIISTAVTSRTSAIVPVHLYGIPADLTGIAAIARKSQLAVVADSAQLHPSSSFPAEMVSRGVDAIAFSFYPTKNLGAFGDAGIVATHDQETHHRFRQLRQYGGSDRYIHEIIGRNSRLDSIQAGLLATMLPRLDDWNAKRRSVASRLSEACLHFPVIGSMITHREWHHFVIRSSRRGLTRNSLKEEGIQSDVHYPYAAYALPAFSDFPGLGPQEVGRCPNADTLARQVISIPCHPWLTSAEVDLLCDFLSRQDDFESHGGDRIDRGY